MLAQAVLVRALGDQVAAAAVELPRKHIQGKGKPVAVDFHGIGPVHLHPLVLPIQVKSLPGRPLDKFRPSHDMGRGMGWRTVLQGPDRLGHAHAHEIPDGAAHKPGMGIDLVPIVIHASATVAGDGEVFVHERGTHVGRVDPAADLMLQRRRIAWTDDILGRMDPRIAAIHPETRGIQTLAFPDHLRDIGSFAALVTGAPEKDAGMVAIPKDHAPHPFPIHRRKPGHVAHEFRRMGFIPGLVDDVQAIFVRQLQILVYRWIVGSADTIEIEPLEDLHVPPNHFLRHPVPQLGMLHVGALGTHFQGLAIQVEHTVPDLRLLEADLLGDLIHGPAIRIHQGEGQIIQVGRFRTPFQRSDDFFAERDPPGSLGRYRERDRGHPGDGLSLPEHGRLQPITSGSGRIAAHIHIHGKVAVPVIRAEVCHNLPVPDPSLGRGVHRHVVKDTGQAPVILALQVIAVAVFENQHRQLVFPGLHIGGHIVLGRFLRSLVIAHERTVHPDETGRRHFLETEENLFSFPTPRHVERRPIGTGRVVVHRSKGYLHGKRIVIAGQAKGIRRRNVPEQGLTVSLHLPVGGDFDAPPFPVVV